MNMVAMALYNPLIPAAEPAATRTFLLCRMSRMTIIRVRRTLSETEIERYRRPKSRVVEAREPPHLLDWKTSVMIPVATLIMLAQSSLLGRTLTRTHRGKVHETREGDDPGIHEVNHVTTIELEELVLDAWVRERGTNQRTNQKAIS